jgi:hypothetical protein
VPFVRGVEVSWEVADGQARNISRLSETVLFRAVICSCEAVPREACRYVGGRVCPGGLGCRSRGEDDELGVCWEQRVCPSRLHSSESGWPDGISYLTKTRLNSGSNLCTEYVVQEWRELRKQPDNITDSNRNIGY